MVFPSLFFILVTVSAVLCAVGFYRFIWFLSVGYGLAVAGCGAAMLIAALMQGGAGLAYLLLCLLFIVYGCRLGLFLLLRELKNAAYKKTLDAQTKPVPFFVQAAMWVLLAFLYPVQVSPVMYRLTNGMAESSDAFVWIGAVVMLLGIVVEATADKQKSAQKKTDPHMAATKGLFQLCRCPNYFGEILVWTGSLISGISALQGWQWAIALLGYVCIVAIMVSGAKRLEVRQNRNYGHLQAYRDYVEKTPILIPFVPIYHLVKEEN
ncbi:MAG: DUF1295 domain-containing protein [Firmicutes bacterium]|nr:DUF1295 domain-containing protein [Bacillota bacterium]